jgi:hypothetical protein
MYFGALLLGVYEGSTLVYAGHVGTGFDEKELARLSKLLKPLEVEKSPFASRPPSNEKPHWVEPKLVAQVRFTEWTADNIRAPVYLGLRDDKKATDVGHERLSGSVPIPGCLVPTVSKGSGASARTHGTTEQLRFLEDMAEAVLTLPGDLHLKVGNLQGVLAEAQADQGRFDPLLR